MPERIANTIILVEDQEQQNLVRRFLERCPQSKRKPPRLVRLPAGQGSGEQHLRREYAKQVRACRSSIGRRASALLIVVVDADMRTTTERARQLENELLENGLDPRGANESIVVLIPKRHVETWIRALLGDEVDEATEYKRPAPTASDIKEAAAKLYQWTRPNAEPGATSPPSLVASIPEWRRIP